MKTPNIRIENHSKDQGVVDMAMYQTAREAGWKKVTAWHVMPLGAGAAVEVAVPEDYSIALRYLRNETMIETAHMLVGDGIGSFQVRGQDGALEIVRMPRDVGAGALDVKATDTFEGPFDLLIFRGKERVFPALTMGPGVETSPKLAGPLSITVWSGAQLGTDLALPPTPNIEVEPGDVVALTGSKKQGYALKITARGEWT